MPTQKTVNDRIPALPLDSDIGDRIYDALSHDRYKGKIKEMITDYTGTVEFEELVMKYAGKEYENRILKSARFWTTTIVTSLITSAIAAGFALLLAHR